MFIKQIKRNYMRKYVVKCVQQVEQSYSEFNAWALTPEVLMLMLEVLINNFDLIYGEDWAKKVGALEIQSNLFNISEFQVYSDEIIKQTRYFVNGEISSMPVVDVSHLTGRGVYPITLATFLSTFHKDRFLSTLENIVKICNSLDKVVWETNSARRPILLKTISPFLATLFEITEILYAELI